jgi:hypothetical protein
MDLVPLMSLLHKNLAYLADLSQVESIRSADQPMELVDANSVGLS